MLGMVNWRGGLIFVVMIAALGGVFSFPPIPQSSDYHNFADARTILGISNLCNVISNIPFLLVGLWGLVKYFKNPFSVHWWAYLTFCAGVMGVGLGSAYYHFDPNAQTLVWDRLPMTVAFMALFSMVIGDRISINYGAKALIPLVFAGVASVCYWYWSEVQGHGDLRAYVVIQFLPMILIPIMLLVYPGHVIKSSGLWATLGTYGLAKVAEHFDASIFENTVLLSGHTIKHLLAALAVWWVVMAFDAKVSSKQINGLR